jgi:hypothetical protein
MNWNRLRSLLLVSCLAVFVTAGCSKGNTLLSPTSPSGLPGGTALLADDGSEIALTSSDADAFSTLARGGGGNDKDRGNSGGGNDDDDEDEAQGDDGEGDDERRGPARGERGSLSGFVTATGADSVTVRGVVVIATATTIIRHGQTMMALADIAIGDHVQAKGMMVGADLVATEIKVEDTGNDNEGGVDEGADETEVAGAVGGLTGTASCTSATPALTFTVGATTVKTDASTTFDDVTCAALADTNLVEVEGTLQTDGSILAEKVELQSGPDEVIGRLSGLTGTDSCSTATPALTFTIGTTTVTTSSTTTFTGVTCATVVHNMRLEVEGTLTGSTLAAASVELK